MFLNEEDNNPFPPPKIPRFITVVIAGFLFICDNRYMLFTCDLSCLE